VRSVRIGRWDFLAGKLRKSVEEKILFRGLYNVPAGKSPVFNARPVGMFNIAQQDVHG
jgi:hypothetical protein